jgi:DHA1 family tetracycline resistance protein-like MFS transporter
LGPVIRKFGEPRTALIGLSSSCLVLLGFGLAPMGWIMYLLIPCNLMAYAANPAMQAIFSKAVDARSQGAVMGSLAALGSLMSVAATLLGTSVLAQVGHLPKAAFFLGAPFFLASVAQVFALVIAARHFAVRNQQREPEFGA